MLPTLRATVSPDDPTIRAGMDEISMYRPDELLAVELYVNPKSAPKQYMRPSDRNCGLLLVWTKR